MEGPFVPPRRKSLIKKTARTVAVLDNESELTQKKGVEKPIKPPPPNRLKQPISPQQNAIKKPPRKPPLPQNTIKRPPGRPPNPKAPQKAMDTEEETQTKPKPVPRPRVERPVPAPRKQGSLSFSDSEEKTRTLSKTGSIEMPEVPETCEDSLGDRDNDLNLPEEIHVVSEPEKSRENENDLDVKESFEESTQLEQRESIFDRESKTVLNENSLQTDYLIQEEIPPRTDNQSVLEEKSSNKTDDVLNNVPKELSKTTREASKQPVESPEEKHEPLKRKMTSDKVRNVSSPSYENIKIREPQKRNDYVNVRLKNEDRQSENEADEDIYSAPLSTLRPAISSSNNYDKEIVDEGIYSAPSSNPTLKQSLSAPEDSMYSAPSSTLKTFKNNENDFIHKTLNGVLSAPVQNTNKPVIPYSMLRPDESESNPDDSNIYSNIHGDDKTFEEEKNLYSAPSSTPVKKIFPVAPSLSEILKKSPSKESNRTSKDSSIVDEETYQVPSPKPTPRDSKYEDMSGSSSPSTKKRGSQYETIFPSPNSSPSKTDIQKRTLPPRPPRPKSFKKLESQETEDDVADIENEEEELNLNLYQSVESLRRGDAIILQREGLSDSDSDSDSDGDGYTSPLEEKLADFEDKSKLFFIAYEILTTEKSFVEALTLICEDFGTPLKQAMERNPRLLPEGAYSQIFMNIELIYELDKKFLHDLEERMENWELHKRIGDLVREYGHFLKMYTTYIKGYDNAMALYHDCINTNLKFSQLVKDFEKSKKAKNLKLTSYLLKPIQRIPSYRLLLKDYLKHLPEDSTDFNDIKDSVLIVTEVANYINESMKEGEKFQEVLRIQSQIVNANDIIKPGRFLLKEGTLMKLSRKELQQRTFILFTDSLLYCAHIGHGQLKLILELPLAGMLVQYPDSQELSTEFSVISTKRSFLLNASSPKEREDWVAALEDAICVVNTKLGSFSIKRRDDTMTLQQMRSELGVIAPPWIPDSRVTMCQVCTIQFNVYNRRHHCRGCGKVVCKTCSCFEAPLKYMENESARVCEKCYETLLEISKTNSDEQYLIPKFKETKAKKKPKKRVENLPSTLTEIEAQQEGIENSGFLRLKRGGKKDKRSWFVLKEHVLYVYKASSDPAANSTIPILGYQLDITGNWDEDDFGFQLSHAGVKENLSFHAENRSSAERWVHCFCKATALLNT